MEVSDFVILLIDVTFFINMFNPLNAGAAYIRVFIFIQLIMYHLSNLLNLVT